MGKNSNHAVLNIVCLSMI